MLSAVKYLALVASAFALPRNITSGVCPTGVNGNGCTGGDTTACTFGRSQSPIDIKANNIEFSSAKANAWLPNLNYSLSNTKNWTHFFPTHANVATVERHALSGAMVITFNNSGPGNFEIWDGPMGERYYLEQIHYFYGASQHSFDNLHQSAEFHWIFTNGDLQETAKSNVVLAVLVSRGNMNVEFQKLVDQVNNTSAFKVPTSVPVNFQINLNALLPPNWWFEFYTYEGSMTTSPCVESVTYIIPARTLPLWWRQIDQIVTSFNTTTGAREANRFTQPHYSRTVAKSFGGNNCGNNGLGGLGGLGLLGGFGR